jgi:hypothetical protein
MTNAVKAGIIAVTNLILSLVVSFGVPVTDEQTALITALVNAGLGLWVAFTYKNRPKRVPDFDA